LVSARARLVLAACLGASLYAWTETCSGPAALEARLHAHPNADAYAALGNWFSENHKTNCAVEAFQAGLKLEPGSARLNYRLGLSLYAAGRMQEAVAPLQQSIQFYSREVNAHLVLGATLAGLGRDKEALPEWEAALKAPLAGLAARARKANVLFPLGLALQAWGLALLWLRGPKPEEPSEEDS
jgi:tetratricopeptide (TPR) repeat protein